MPKRCMKTWLLMLSGICPGRAPRELELTVPTSGVLHREEKVKRRREG